jgi:rubrerythrin
MQATRGIDHAGDFFAHAIAIEREAVRRYLQFAEHMSDRGSESTAELFRRLAEQEARHASLLEQRAGGLRLSELKPWEHSWLDDAAPDAVNHDVVFHLMTPYHALRIALRAERDAHAFFARSERGIDDQEVRQIAAQLAREENAHIASVEQGLARAPRPIDWERDFGQVPASLC